MKLEKNVSTVSITVITQFGHFVKLASAHFSYISRVLGQESDSSSDTFSYARDRAIFLFSLTMSLLSKIF